MILGGGAATTAHEKLLGNLLVAESIKTTPLIGFCCYCCCYCCWVNSEMVGPDHVIHMIIMPQINCYSKVFHSSRCCCKHLLHGTHSLITAPP